MGVFIALQIIYRYLANTYLGHKQGQLGEKKDLQQTNLLQECFLLECIFERKNEEVKPTGALFESPIVEQRQL